MTTPLVSIYIPTRNRARLLDRALASACAQSREDIEVVVVDDGSEDGTPALLTRWQESGQVRWFRNEQPLGACAARNRALTEARGRYVAGLDDDDEMLPGRIDALLSALQPTDAFVCASDLLQTPGEQSRRRIVPARIDITTILRRNVVGNQILAERHKMLACGGFDESLPAAQDYDMWIRMIVRHGPARGLQRPLQVVHIHHEGSRITTASNRRSGYFRVYLKHKGLMERETRAIHLYNLHKASGKKLGLRLARAFFVRGNRLRLLSRALSERIPAVGPGIHRVSEAYLRAVRR